MKQKINSVLRVVHPAIPQRLKRYRHLASLLAMVLFAIAMVMLGAPVVTGVGIVCLYQLSQFAMSRRTARCYTAAAGLTPEQIKEFEKITEELKGYGTLLKELGEIAKAEGGWAAIKQLPELLKQEKKRNDDLHGELKKLQKRAAQFTGPSGVRWIGNVPFITEEAARGLASDVLLQWHARDMSRNQEERWKSGSKFRMFLDEARAFAGLDVHGKAAEGSAQVPLPTLYMAQVIELVFAYGAARQYATVYPLGAGTVKLPQLQPGESAFGFVGIGVGGMSQAIPEKQLPIGQATFTANKAGGLIRIPTEIEEDTLVALGQALARYIARQFAKLEDTTLFLADGSATYADITGVGPYCVENPAYLQQLAQGKVKPTDATLADFRALRTKVNPAVLANMAANQQVAAAYYMNPTMEALLVTFNTIGSPLIYIPASGGKPATLDGFPIHWIGVSQADVTVAAPGAFLAFFGDLSFWYLGERGAPRVEVSRDVFFASDELAMRALERIDVEPMAADAMAALQTAEQ